jgi:hypothetical protein
VTMSGKIDVPTVDEAIAIFDKSAERTTPNAQTAAWAVLRAEIERLRAMVYGENQDLRDALDDVNELIEAAKAFGDLPDVAFTAASSDEAAADRFFAALAALEAA